MPTRTVGDSWDFKEMALGPEEPSVDWAYRHPYSAPLSVTGCLGHCHVPPACWPDVRRLRAPPTSSFLFSQKCALVAVLLPRRKEPGCGAPRPHRGGSSEPPSFSPQTAIDILTTVVRSSEPPLSQLLICQAFPAVAQCTLHTDDSATMQVSHRVTGRTPAPRARAPRRQGIRTVSCF